MPLRVFFRDISDVFKKDELGLEIATIALPAALALAADPIASLIDTAFIGHIGPVELAAVGVAIAVFNQVSKIAIFPLVSVTMSFVAEEDAAESLIDRSCGIEITERRFDGNDEVEEFIPNVAGFTPLIGALIADSFSGHFWMIIADSILYVLVLDLLVSFLSILFLFILSPSNCFVGLWVGLSIFMILRAVAGFWRIGTGTGPWSFLRR